MWFCMVLLFLACYKRSIPCQSFAMGSSRCVLRRQRMPYHAASWRPVQDINLSKKHIQQKNSRNNCMQPSTGVITSSGCRCTKSKLRKMRCRSAKSAFEIGFVTQLGLYWNTGRKGKGKKKGARGAAQASNPQCDLSLKKDAPPMHVATLFRRTCFKNASLSGVASRWEDLTVSCSGGDRADTCEFAEQAMAARESNALWSVGNPTARLLPGVHKRIRCPRVRVSRCYSSGAAQTGWPRKTEVCSVFCGVDPL